MLGQARLQTQVVSEPLAGHRYPADFQSVPVPELKVWVRPAAGNFKWP